MADAGADTFVAGSAIFGKQITRRHRRHAPGPGMTAPVQGLDRGHHRPDGTMVDTWATAQALGAMLDDLGLPGRARVHRGRWWARAASICCGSSAQSCADASGAAPDASKIEALLSQRLGALPAALPGHNGVIPASTRRAPEPDERCAAPLRLACLTNKLASLPAVLRAKGLTVSSSMCRRRRLRAQEARPCRPLQTCRGSARCRRVR